MTGQRIWVTGAGGLIGNYLVQTGPACVPGSTITGLTRSQLDLADFGAVRALFAEHQPRIIIHCAALSRSPACQANPVLARRLNVEATGFLSDLAADRLFVFFSTDLVFDGSKGNYDESDPPNPLSVYAETKAEAERLVLRNPAHTVIRTSLNGGTSPTGDRGFNEEIRRAWESGRKLTLFTDEFRSPIAAEVTARAVWELAMLGRPGIYHVAGSEKLSRWEIGQLLAARWPHLSPQLEPGSLKQYKGAPRAPDTTLNCAKAQRLLSFPLPRFSAWLAEDRSRGS